MKNLIFTFIALFTAFAGYSQYDVTATGDFTPNTVQVGGTATYDINITNISVVAGTIPAGYITLNANVGGGTEVDMNNPPAGPDGDKFDWTFLGDTVGWYGVSNTALPLGIAFQIKIPVTGTYVSENHSTYDAGIKPPLGWDINPNNDTGYSTLTVTQVLPVEYNYFTVKSTDCDEVVLAWETTREMNNEGFYIERSLGDARDFKRIAFLESQRNLGPNGYTFHDDISGLSHGGTIFYRLNQKDFDGNTTLTDIIRADIDCQGRWTITGYPNPVLNKYNLDVEGTSEIGDAVVFDASGKIVAKYNLTVNTVNTIDLSTLHSGMYSVKVLDKSGEQAIKTIPIIKIANH